MTTNKSKAAMRYAARLACIYDWTQGEMERLPERLSKGDCLNAIHALSGIREKEVKYLWEQVSRECVGISNKDVSEAGHWDLPELVRVYNMQRREIEAVEVLKRVYEKDGRNLFEISDECRVYCWTLKGWMTRQKRISWKMVKSLEKLEKEGREYTIMEAFRGMQEVFENADPSGIKKEKESDGQGA